MGQVLGMGSELCCSQRVWGAQNGAGTVGAPGDGGANPCKPSTETSCAHFPWALMGIDAPHFGFNGIPAAV